MGGIYTSARSPLLKKISTDRRFQGLLHTLEQASEAMRFTTELRNCKFLLQTDIGKDLLFIGLGIGLRTAWKQGSSAS